MASFGGTHILRKESSAYLLYRKSPLGEALVDALVDLHREGHQLTMKTLHAILQIFDSAILRAIKLPKKRDTIEFTFVAERLAVYRKITTEYQLVLRSVEVYQKFSGKVIQDFLKYKKWKSRQGYTPDTNHALDCHEWAHRVASVDHLLVIADTPFGASEPQQWDRHYRLLPGNLNPRVQLCYFISPEEVAAEKEKAEEDRREREEERTARQRLKAPFDPRASAVAIERCNSHLTAKERAIKNWSAITWKRRFRS